LLLGFLLPFLTTTPERHEPPALSRPFNNTVFAEYPRTTALSWFPGEGAERYLVEVQYQVPPSNPWYDLPYYPIEVAGESYTFDFIGAQAGRWRVTAVGPDQVHGRPSKWQHFRYQQ
jgi:hypothetical protein